MSELFQRHHYEGREGSTLEVQLDEQSTAELSQVEFQDSSNEHIDGFTVVFEAPADQEFDQGMYPVKHPEAGEGEMFLVPMLNEASDKPQYGLTVANLKESGTEE